MANTLVVGYDGRPGAQRALAEAVTLTRDLGAELIVCFGYDVALGQESADLRAEVRKLGEKIAVEAAERAKAAGADVRVELVNDRPAEALAEIAESEDARMIVVGRNDRARLPRLTGSVPHKLAALAPCPVLVVNAAGDED